MARVRELDSVRGLAALMVVLHHTLFVSGVLDQVTVDHLKSTPLRVLVAGRAFVLLFFVLSGYVLAGPLARRPFSLRGYLVWAVQRSIRLIGPAAFSLLLAAGIYRLTFDPQWPGLTPWVGQQWTMKLSWIGLLGEGSLLGGARLNSVLWSLDIEWRLSLLMPFMLLLASRRNGLAILSLIALGLAGFAGGTWPERMGFDTSWLGDIQRTLYFVLPFAIGIVLERTGAARFTGAPALIWCALFAIVGLFRDPTDASTFIASGLLIWVVQQPSFLRDALRHKLPVWLGKISFSLYLVHLPLMLGLLYWLHATYSPVTIAVLSIAGSLPLAWLFYTLIESRMHLLARSFDHHAEAYPNAVLTPTPR